MQFRLRRSARVLLFERTSGDLLLIRFETELDGLRFVFWVTPGGEIEGGEQERSAAERELLEELGLRSSLQGPVHRESGGTYVHLGETVGNEDVFFTAVCARDEPQLAGVTDDEKALMREARWWTLSELEATQDRVFPMQLPAVARRVWAEMAASDGCSTRADEPSLR